MHAQALYDPANEHDACGVGLVANVNNIASHQIVLQGITVLKRLMHRGAAGGDPETGDGAGLLLSMPHKFFRKVCVDLPERYGVAMFFVENTLEATVFDAEIKRIADAGEAACNEEAVAKAAASLGYKITPEELKRAIADSAELSESDMEQISAGNFFADLEEVLRRIFADDKKPRS